MALNKLLHLQNISKVFQDGRAKRTALRDIDLTIEEGEYVSISGPSGGGKSTLLAIMGLLDAPTSGRYLLASRDVSRLSLTERASVRNQQIGYIFQSFNLIGDLTIADNVELPLTYRPGMSHRQRRSRVSNMLERVGLYQRKDDLPAELSGGEQQRVAVARALAGSPSILLADEPTGNLDTASGLKIRELLTELHNEGSTLCVVTHDVHFAEEADRSVRLLDGTIESPALIG